MSSFQNPFAQFDQALADVELKKTALDKANKELQAASIAYNKSVDAATSIRDNINQLLANVLPSTTGNVRISN